MQILAQKKNKRRQQDSQRRQSMTAAQREEFNAKRRTLHHKRKANPEDIGPNKRSRDDMGGPVPSQVGHQSNSIPHSIIVPHPPHVSLHGGSMHSHGMHGIPLAVGEAPVPQALSMMHSV